MHGQRIGYVRVSSFDQNPERQLESCPGSEKDAQPGSLGMSKKETITMIGSRAFIALMVGGLLTSAVQAEPRAGDIAGVYPSAGPGDRTLYAIARVNPGAGSATTRSGESIIQVFVTGRDRRVEGTASHYFAVPRNVSTRVQLDALHSAPGPNHFIQIAGREYALQRIMIEVREGHLRLEGAVLVRTGFLPMIMRGRIELRLDSALNPGDPADEMTAKALEDTTRSDNIGRAGYEKALRDYQTKRARE